MQIIEVPAPSRDIEVIEIEDNEPTSTVTSNKAISQAEDTRMGASMSQTYPKDVPSASTQTKKPLTEGVDETPEGQPASTAADLPPPSESDTALLSRCPLRGEKEHTKTATTTTFSTLAKLLTPEAPTEPLASVLKRHRSSPARATKKSKKDYDEDEEEEDLNARASRHSFLKASREEQRRHPRKRIANM